MNYFIRAILVIACCAIIIISYKLLVLIDVVCGINITTYQKALISYQSIEEIDDAKLIEVEKIYDFLGEEKPKCLLGGVYTWKMDLPVDEGFILKCSIGKHNPAYTAKNSEQAAVDASGY